MRRGEDRRIRQGRDRRPEHRGAAWAGALQRAGHAVEFAYADVTVEEDVRRAVQQVVDCFGRLDAVIGCAGISGPVGSTALEIDVDDWDRVMAVNVKGNFFACQAYDRIAR